MFIRTVCYTSSTLESGCCSKYCSNVWYRTSIVPDCTLVHTARGPTPRNQPAIPSVLYIIFRPVITDDVSRVAAPWALRVVDGEDVDIGRLCVEPGFTLCAGVVCFDVDAGERVALGATEDPEVGPLC